MILEILGSKFLDKERHSTDIKRTEKNKDIFY